MLIETQNVNNDLDAKNITLNACVTFTLFFIGAAANSIAGLRVIGYGN